MKEFGQICAVLIMMIALVITNGIVVSCMWNWFIVPLGVSAIGFWLAAGISMTVSLFTTQHNTPKRELPATLPDKELILR
jgi:hypothetical protein